MTFRLGPWSAGIYRRTKEHYIAWRLAAEGPNSVSFIDLHRSDLAMPERLTITHLAALDRDAFVGALGAVFEHSPWVVERAWQERPFASRESLLAVFGEILSEAGRELQLSLIKAHPELAGKLAARGELTADSTREQAGAGLAACSPDEFMRLRRLNAAYREKFGWPFIVAVKGLSRQKIIAEMRWRIKRTPDQEFAEALAQILRIASFRLDDQIDSE